VIEFDSDELELLVKGLILLRNHMADMEIQANRALLGTVVSELYEIGQRAEALHHKINVEQRVRDV
jgi:hypothetical protein